VTNETPGTQAGGHRRRRIAGQPVGRVLAVAVGGLTLGGVGVSLFLGLTDAIESTRGLFHERAFRVIETVIDQVQADMLPVEARGRWVASRVAEGEIDPRDAETWQAFLAGTTAGSPNIIGAMFVAADGPAILMPREGHPREDQTAIPADMMARVERLGSASPGYVEWSEPLRSPGGGRMVMSLWTPVFSTGEYRGVFVQAIGNDDLSRRLVEAARDTRITPFVLFERDFVAAHPSLMAGGSDAESRAEATAHLPFVDEVGDPLLARLWSDPGARPIDFSKRAAPPGVEGRVLGSGYDRRILVFRTLAVAGGTRWTVGAHFGTDIADEEIRRLWQSAAVGGGVLLLAILAALLMARYGSRPILRLAEAARRVQAGDLNGCAPVPEGRVRELNEACQAFNAMIEGLRERERIRGLFGKYVPEAVAAELVRDGGAPKPVSAEATVLFADLAGFTSLSERLDPGEIVEMLNAYFSAAVEVLETYGGVVTQFQGDGILAVFNVPLADPDHAAKAVRAAVELRDRVAGAAFAGHRLACRIGVNTGPVVAGSVGASDRLSYTVHGDAVNLAARLEQLNKEHGTSILVSETTARRAGDTPLRRIGAVAVRGKRETVTLFTPAE
jgi:adenylate cyclase